MSLVPSLLQAIVRVDGDALVMHAGDKPYVVTPSGQVDLASRGLNLEAVNGVVNQLLPPELQHALEEFGAVQYELPPNPEFPGEHFTVVVARGGDDVWTEIRRRRVPDDDRVPEELFQPTGADGEPQAPPELTDVSLDGIPDMPPATFRETSVETIEAEPAVEVAHVEEPVEAHVEKPRPQPVEAKGRINIARAFGKAPADAVAKAPASDEDDLRLPDEAQLFGRAPAAAVDQPSMHAKPDLDFETIDEPLIVEPLVDEPLIDEPAAIEPPPVVVLAPAPVAVRPAPVVAPPPPAPPPLPPAPVVQAPVVAQQPIGHQAVAEQPIEPQPIVQQPAARVSPQPPTPAPVAAPVAPQRTMAPPAPPPAASPVAPPPVAARPVAPPPPPLPAPPLQSPPAPQPVAEALLAPPQPTAEAQLATPEPVVEAQLVTPQPMAEAQPATPEPVVEARLATPQPMAEARPQPLAEVRLATPKPLAEPPQPAVVLPISRSPIRADQPPPLVSDPTLSGLERLLRVSAARGASTLYLSSQSRSSVRVDGELQILEGEPLLTARDVESLLLTLMPERSHEALRTGAATEWILDIEGVGRVRCMSFRDHRGPGGVFRLMPTRSVSVDQLGLPPQVQSLAIEPEGLVLVAGPRSSGKRTLMSAFVDLMNHTRKDHIITIEREINIVHERLNSFISQREVRGSDEDMLAAARAALREDPDVLVIEDLRTGALMNVALEAAASGHLVIGGFSAHTATGAIDRIIDLYAPEYRRQVQFALADSMRGVIVQVLLKKIGGGRLPAREVLLNTPSVSSVIAEGKTSQLPMAIEGGRRYGMIPLNDALVGLVQSGAVDGRDAYRQSPDRQGLLAALTRNGVDTSFVERLA